MSAPDSPGPLTEKQIAQRNRERNANEKQWLGQCKELVRKSNDCGDNPPAILDWCQEAMEWVSLPDNPNATNFHAIANAAHGLAASCPSCPLDLVNFLKQQSLNDADPISQDMTQNNLRRLADWSRKAIAPADPGEQGGGSEESEGEAERATTPAGTGKQGKGSGESKGELKASREKAYRLFRWAVETDPSLANNTDREVYDWLKAKPDTGDDLPEFDTWSRYLREAREHHSDSKNTPRTAKPASKNVIRRDQI